MLEFLKDRSTRKIIPLVLILFFTNVLAYCLFMFSMKAVNMSRAPSVELLYLAVIIFNSLLLPFVLCLCLFLFRSLALAIILQVGFLATILICSVYHQYFQSLPHIILLKQVYLLPFVSSHIAVQLIGKLQIFFIFLIFLLSWMIIKVHGHVKQLVISGETRKRMAIIGLLVMGIFVFKGVCVNAKTPVLLSLRFNSVDAIKKHGILPFYVSQIVENIFKEERQAVWPGKINGKDSAAQAVTGKAKSNIIIVQVESLDAHFFDYKIGDQYVMPRLHQLKQEGLFFENFFAQHRGGATTDAELSVLTGLLPLNTHSGFTTANFSKIHPLNKALSGHGYQTILMHSNVGSFFNRTLTYSLLGFDIFLDQDAYTGEATGRNMKDRAFLDQSAAMLRSFKEPFFAYLITMQLHGPFTHHTQDPNLFELDESMSYEERNYILSAREIDNAVADFMENLDQKGFLDDSIVLIFGDHESGLRWPFEEEKVCPGDKPCRVPLLVLGKGIPKEISYKAGSQVDLGPTILDLLGIQEPDGWVGSSLVREGEGRVVLNYGTPYVLKNNAHSVVKDPDTDKYLPFIDYSIAILDSK